MKIAQNLRKIKETLPEGVRLTAVSKFHPDEAIMEAYEAGQRIFGENRVQELAGKYERLPKDIEWHLIGHLQTNKAHIAVPIASMIQSVDSERLLTVLDSEALKCGKKLKILLQVHIAQEEQKFGFRPDEAASLFSSGKIKKYENLVPCGLMGMATFTDDSGQIRSEFRSLAALFRRIRAFPQTGDEFTEISMGMSDDYPIAVAEGSTIVRIGSLIFGPRP
ncbi:MAG: YggS family pyridoxal phosphate-dependent enzyme [Dysgonamonadaceae bacterium]|jgi:pyridoxal phosphate enzyme (YggS family)|nr:YggS family pyridoxal phosphate-dependent enzyme [Dysgonamonadaceae bacterium]